MASPFCDYDAVYRHALHPRFAPLLPVCCHVCTLVSPVEGQEDYPTPKPTDQFEVPERCRVSLFTASPQLFNPTAIDVDQRGCIWVTEAVNYRAFSNKGSPRPP